jgi:hypothetical protein
LRLLPIQCSIRPEKDSDPNHTILARIRTGFSGFLKKFQGIAGLLGKVELA